MTTPTTTTPHPQDCDCLCFCGDDTRLHTGQVRPCADEQKRRDFALRVAAAQSAVLTHCRTGAPTTIGCAAAWAAVPLLHKGMEQAPDRPAFWRDLLGGLAALARVDIGQPAAAAVVAGLVADAQAAAAATATRGAA